MVYNLALVGFGNVGKALVRLLRSKRSILREQYGIEFRITGVASRRIGWLADEGGFDIDGLSDGIVPAQAGPGPSNVREWLKAACADVLFEATSLNRHTGEPANSRWLVPLQDEVAKSVEVAERLGHLFAFDQQKPAVQPVSRKRLAGESLGLRNLILVVREHQVFTTGVDVERLAEIFH